MSEVKEAALQELRARYNAAYAASRSCTQALTDTSVSGEPASADLLACEAKAQRDLTDARGKLLAAMTEATNGDPPGLLSR